MWGFFYPPKTPPPKDLRDGSFFGQDNFFYGYFDHSEHVSSVGLMLKALDRILHHPKVAEKA